MCMHAIGCSRRRSSAPRHSRLISLPLALLPLAVLRFVALAVLVPARSDAQPINVTLGKPVVASEVYLNHVGEHAVDGDETTRWENRARNRIAQLEIDLGGTFELERAEILIGIGSGFAHEFVQLQYHDGYCWVPIPGATVSANPESQQFLDLPFSETVTATRIRYHSLDDQNNLLRELRVFGTPAPATSGTGPSGATGRCAAGEHRAVRTPWYDYAQHLPSQYNDDASRRWPLVFAMHGIGGNILTGDHLDVRSTPEGFPRQIENGTLDDFPAIVVSPHCRAVGQTSNCWFDEQRVLPMLDDLQASLLVDIDRVFVTGLSGGGIRSYQLGIAHGPRFAGVVPVASNVTPQCGLKETNVWAFGGTADPSFPASVNQFILRFLRDSCEPIGVSYMQATDIEGGTHSGSTWDVAYATPELHDWLLETVRRHPVLFADGFESGDLSGWSDAVSAGEPRPR